MMARLCRCGSIVEGRCSKCDYKATHAEFYSSSRWRKLSERKRRADPLCEKCLGQDKTTAATEVHHIVGVDESESLRYEWSNLMSVCKSCHDALDRERRKHV